MNDAKKYEVALLLKTNGRRFVVSAIMLYIVVWVKHSWLNSCEKYWNLLLLKLLDIQPTQGAFFTTGYEPHRISPSVYICGETFRKPGYPNSADPHYLKDLFSEINLMAPPSTASLCLQSPAFPKFYEKVNLQNEAKVRGKLLKCGLWKMNWLCRRVLQTSVTLVRWNRQLPSQLLLLPSNHPIPKYLHLQLLFMLQPSLNIKPEVAQNILSSVNQALSIGPIDDLVNENELRVASGHKGCTTVNLLPDQLIVPKSSVKVKNPQKRKRPTKEGAVLNKTALDRIGTIKDLEKGKVLRDGRKERAKRRQVCLKLHG